MVANIFRSINNLIKQRTRDSTGGPEEPRYIPGIVLDVMLVTIFHADIADIEAQIDLLTQTISEITKAVKLVEIPNGDVALSLDVSIRRLDYLCHKLPSLTGDCSELTKELDHQLVEHYLNDRKNGINSLRGWQRILGISPHWRQILEREGLLVAVDGVNDPGSGFATRPR